MSVATAGAAPKLTVPAKREAREPAEVRGRGRDDVRVLVATRSDGAVRHLRFPDLADVLAAGDVLVVNTSATLPAALPATRSDRQQLLLHVSTRLPGGLWLVELRRPVGAGSMPFGAGEPGEVLELSGGGRVDLLARFTGLGDRRRTPRLWVAALALPIEVRDYLARHGRPIRYGYASAAWPIETYQTVFAAEAGSAEMPSAGRPFTAEMVTRLVSRGIGVVPVLLHAGVSSPEDDEAPAPEYYRVPAATARWVNVARQGDGRVVAVGTTVVRALETVADDLGVVHAGEGWTELVVDRERGVGAVDGLLTGWHEPSASHFDLVEAVAGPNLLARSYHEALEHGYLWHEFGDLCLILP